MIKMGNNEDEHEDDFIDILERDMEKNPPKFDPVQAKEFLEKREKKRENQEKLDDMVTAFSIIADVSRIKELRSDAQRDFYQILYLTARSAGVFPGTIKLRDYLSDGQNYV